MEGRCLNVFSATVQSYRAAMEIPSVRRAWGPHKLVITRFREPKQMVARHGVSIKKYGSAAYHDLCHTRKWNTATKEANQPNQKNQVPLEMKGFIHGLSQVFRITKEMNLGPRFFPGPPCHRGWSWPDFLLHTGRADSRHYKSLAQTYLH